MTPRSALAPITLRLATSLALLLEARPSLAEGGGPAAPPAQLPAPAEVLGPRAPAFILTPAIDIPVLGLGAVFAMARFVRTEPASCAPVCDPSYLNPLDRPFAGRWSTGWARASDVGAISLGVGAVALLTLDEGLGHGLNDLVVVAEAGLLSTAVASLGTLPAARPRPFLHGERAPLEDRMSADGALSFISSHSAVSFSLVTSSFFAMRRLHPGSALPWIVLGVGLAGAGTVGAARMLAGKHFPTDVIAGAVVGSSVGALVPALHRASVIVAPDVSSTVKGVVLLHVF